MSLSPSELQGKSKLERCDVNVSETVGRRYAEWSPTFFKLRSYRRIIIVNYLEANPLGLMVEFSDAHMGDERHGYESDTWYHGLR
jgi:hypothetical protein